MNLNRLPVLLLPTFIRDVETHSQAWVEMNYARIDPDIDDIVRAKIMGDIRRRYESYRYIGDLFVQPDPLLFIYSWCFKFLGVFDLRTSYDRFLSIAAKLNYKPVVSVEGYEEYWKVEFEYIYATAEQEYGNRSVTRTESFIGELMDGWSDPTSCYKNLLKLHGDEFELGKSMLDAHFCAIWKQRQKATA